MEEKGWIWQSIYIETKNFNRLKVANLTVIYYAYKTINRSAAEYGNGGCILTVWFLWGFIP